MGSRFFSRVPGPKSPCVWILETDLYFPKNGGTCVHSLYFLLERIRSTSASLSMISKTQDSSTGLDQQHLLFKLTVKFTALLRKVFKSVLMFIFGANISIHSYF